ncbi:response regulator [Herbiconiux sp. VKM Ac-1786]|jgi:CheY-like chemotaxis protein|uniref:response regulator n=1 Tax=Herbiconiux sp. VKM Ac-1786 TaxID=2783824 RepID=UPI00188A681E|nr:response regulator [Herbiconiux sp. VKM Ac-1786]MBF4573361.1 response regulator [Herbiconiux sp. VKM Ac-1786]
MKVLIADDDADLRDLVSIAVEKAGYEVAAAVGDGLSAWEALKADEIDLAVLDISMPGLTGLELVQRIRADDELREQHVLIITANAQPSTAEAVHLAGANGLITKPFQVRELVEFMRGVADRV